MKRVPLFLSFLMPLAAQYLVDTATVDGIEVVKLKDPSRKMEVTIVPSMGNNSVSFTVAGKEYFWSPEMTLAEWKAKPGMRGNPFLAPWANRIGGWAYWANGKKYLLNRELGNVRADQNQNPIHGMLTYASDWQVVEKSTGDGAFVRSRLQFSKWPDRMAQFPFAHTIDMTYRLKDGKLEVETAIQNYAAAPMPVAIGYHPYFQLPGVPRDEWTVKIPARDHLELSAQLIPNGGKLPMPSPNPFPLKGNLLDDVFTGLERGDDGNSTFVIAGGAERLSIVMGPKFTVGVVYSPKTSTFICIEPMSAITDAFNRHHEGAFAELQSIPPGGAWKESYWIVPGGVK